VDILAGISSEWLKALTWIAALACAAALLFWRPRRPDLAALAAVIAYMAASVGAGIYVLNHLGDGRWGGDKEARLDPPSFAETPLVGEALRPLDGVMNGMADGVNDFVDFRAALPVALDYFAAAGWALALMVPLGVAAFATNTVRDRRRAAESAAQVTEVARLRAELELVKRHVGYPEHDII
jgi:hypothetical protein